MVTGDWFSRNIFLKSLISVVTIQVIWLTLWRAGSFGDLDILHFVHRFDVYHGVYRDVELVLRGYRLFWSVLFPFPAFVLWFWRSTLSSELKKGLEKVVPNTAVPNPEISMVWHIPISLVAVVVAFGVMREVYSEPGDAARWVVDYGISIFFISMSVLGYMHLIHWFKNQIKGGIRVQPLHPDQCGGSSFVGSMFLKFALFIVVLAGFSISFYVWHPNPPFYWVIAGIFYFVAIYIFVIDPLTLVHNMMEKSRDDLLIQISLRFGEEIRRVTTHSKLDSVALQREQESHNIVRATYPVWPFTLPWRRVLEAMAVLPPVIAVIVSST